MNTIGDDLEDALALMPNRTASALAIYRTMKEGGVLKRYRVNSYRCREHGCLLLDVYNTPAGLAWYIPPVKLSPQENATTTDENARVERTSDGDRRWVEHADLLLHSPAEYWVNCDHRRNVKITAVEAAANAKIGGPPVIYMH